MLKNFLFQLELTFIAEKRIHILLIDSVLPLTLVSILLPNSTHCNFLVTCGNFRQMAHTHSSSDKMDSVDYDVLEMEVCDVLDYVFGLRSCCLSAFHQRHISNMSPLMTRCGSYRDNKLKQDPTRTQN